MSENTINPAFKYEITFEHDGIKEVFYALNKEDLKAILNSLKSACSFGTYKNCKIDHKEINV